MKELYSKFGLDMDFEDDKGNYITGRFEDLFGDYQSDLSGLGHAMAAFAAIFLLIINFIPNLIFVICYCCHLKRKECYKFKVFWSYFSLIISIIISINYTLIAFYAKTKIDLPDYQIYQFDETFNRKTRKNLKLMRIRKIVLISGTSIMNALYICHFILLILFNKLLANENPGRTMTTENNNDLEPNNVITVNQVQIINTNERENEEKS